jgi:hypothetical protein
MFLGGQDIQLGVNESLLDTSRVVSSMVDGIMARVGGHDEIEVSKHYSIGNKGWLVNRKTLFHRHLLRNPPFPLSMPYLINITPLRFWQT